MAVYALLQFPSGAIADRVGAVRVIALGAVVAGVGSLALLFDTPFAVLAGAMLVIGAGTGAHKTVAIRLLSRVYPVRTGRALGAHDTVGALGGWPRPRRSPSSSPRRPRSPGSSLGSRALTGAACSSSRASSRSRLREPLPLRVPGRLPADADRGPERGVGAGRERLPRVVRGPTTRGVRDRDDRLLVRVQRGRRLPPAVSLASGRAVDRDRKSAVLRAVRGHLRPTRLRRPLRPIRPLPRDGCCARARGGGSRRRRRARKRGNRGGTDRSRRSRRRVRARFSRVPPGPRRVPDRGAPRATRWWRARRRPHPVDGCRRACSRDGGGDRRRVRVPTRVRAARRGALALAAVAAAGLWATE